MASLRGPRRQPRLELLYAGGDATGGGEGHQSLASADSLRPASDGLERTAYLSAAVGRSGRSECGSNSARIHECAWREHGAGDWRNRQEGRAGAWRLRLLV